MTLTQAELKRHLSYDPDTGAFVRLRAVSSRARVGATPGTLRDDGYRVIRVNVRRYLAHRLAWLYVHGVWPENDLDHINGMRTDNRIANLRCATRSENLFNRGKNANNTSGYKGVHWNKKAQKWQGELKVKGSKIYLGLFTDPKDAASAVASASQKHHGQFAHSAGAQA